MTIKTPLNKLGELGEVDEHQFFKFVFNRCMIKYIIEFIRVVFTHANVFCLLKLWEKSSHGENEKNLINRFPPLIKSYDSMHIH